MSTLYESRRERVAAPQCRRLIPLKHALRARSGQTGLGTRVHPWLLQNCRLDSRLLQDATELAGPDAEVRLLGRGFIRQPDSDGRRVYTFGQAYRYGAGQRVVLERGGGGMLITFAGREVQIIEIKPGGLVERNSVQSLP
ncbi:MAG: hypothetical protein ACYCW6_31200 [Candidatus Xenobia bacterium]